jgi:hypothetical protein
MLDKADFLWLFFFIAHENCCAESGVMDAADVFVLEDAGS